MHVKVELINRDNWNSHTVSIKILEVNFGNTILDNSKWDKISENIAKKPYLEKSETLFER